MATVATRPMTAEEFFAFVHRPENRDRFFELDRGEVVETPQPSKYHGFICGNIARILGNYAAGRREGYVCTNDAGVLVERDPDTVRGPDVTFYQDAQSAADMDRQFALQPPRLAVEVLSPNDRTNRIIRRVGQLLDRGVAIVWVVDPETRDVTVYRPGQSPAHFAEDQELLGEGVLPDLRCTVAEFFAVPGG